MRNPLNTLENLLRRKCPYCNTNCHAVVIGKGRFSKTRYICAYCHKKFKVNTLLSFIAIVVWFIVTLVSLTLINSFVIPIPEWAVTIILTVMTILIVLITHFLPLKETKK